MPKLTDINPLSKEEEEQKNTIQNLYLLCISQKHADAERNLHTYLERIHSTTSLIKFAETIPGLEFYLSQETMKKFWQTVCTKHLKIPLQPEALATPYQLAKAEIIYRTLGVATTQPELMSQAACLGCFHAAASLVDFYLQQKQYPNAARIAETSIPFHGTPAYLLLLKIYLEAVQHQENPQEYQQLIYDAICAAEQLEGFCQTEIANAYRTSNGTMNLEFNIAKQGTKVFTSCIEVKTELAYLGLSNRGTFQTQVDAFQALRPERSTAPTSIAFAMH